MFFLVDVIASIQKNLHSDWSQGVSYCALNTAFYELSNLDEAKQVQHILKKHSEITNICLITICNCQKHPIKLIIKHNFSFKICNKIC